MTSYQEQNQQTGRVILPDLVRAFALIGIALVNVQVFAHPFFGGFSETGLITPVDHAAHFGVMSLFLMKSYTLFSFMFGVGFAYQILSAERRGQKFGGEFSRRVIGLLVLGVLHAALLFQGDILFIYGLLGIILFLFRNRSAASLRRWGIGIYILQIVIAASFAVLMWAWQQGAPEIKAEVMAEIMTEQVRTSDIFESGSFFDVMAVRITEWFGVITFGFVMQGIGALAFFLLGLSAVKSGVISDACAPFWRTCRRIYLPIGLLGSALAAWVLLPVENMMSARGMFGILLITLFAPLSTAGYLGLIAAWAAGPLTRLKTAFARGGSATLTAYLMQSLIFSLIFNGYGLGYYNDLTAAQCVSLALIVALFTLAFSSLWRKKFARGPMESLLRGWTYLGRR